MFKLGKKEPRYDSRDLELAKYFTSSLPISPSTVDWTTKVANWPMMKNDTVGDCTCAGMGHFIQDWTTNCGSPFIPSDAQVIAAYSAITGYTPSDPNTDQGANLNDVLNYSRQTGIAGHKIGAYASLEPKNHTELQDSIYLFGGAYLGIALPLTVQGAKCWQVPSKISGKGAPGSWGGHCVLAVKYDPRWITVITWGALLQMSWAFYDAYCDEAFAVLSQDWINNGVNPDHVALADLQSDLTKI